MLEELFTYRITRPFLIALPNWVRRELLEMPLSVMLVKRAQGGKKFQRLEFKQKKGMT